MWRAYGADGDGVCVVMDKNKLLVEAEANLPLYWTAMIYETPAQYSDRVNEFLNHIKVVVETHHAMLKALPIASITWALGFAMITLALTHKHLAFSEEHEFRYIHISGILPMSQPDIRYFPARNANKIRPVLRVPVREYITDSITLGGTIKDVFKCVIVGPSEDHQMQRRAALIALAQAGFAEIPVYYSEIPYRKNR